MRVSNADVGAARRMFASLPSALRRPSTPSTTTSLASPKRLPTLQSAAASAPDTSCAATSSTASASKWPRSRPSAVSIFGRSLPVRR